MKKIGITLILIFVFGFSNSFATAPSDIQGTAQNQNGTYKVTVNPTNDITEKSINPQGKINDGEIPKEAVKEEITDKKATTSNPVAAVTTAVSNKVKEITKSSPKANTPKNIISKSVFIVICGAILCLVVFKKTRRI